MEVEIASHFNLFMIRELVELGSTFTSFADGKFLDLTHAQPSIK